METLNRDVKDVVKALKVLTQKIEKIGKQLDKSTKPRAVKTKTGRKPPVKKAAAKKPAAVKKPATAADTALAVIKRSKKGVTSAGLMKKTGFDKKKAANLFFKLKKQGKIKSKEKGIYVKA